MAVLFSNNAQGTLSVAINTVVTSLILGAGQGALFPVIVAPDYFMATIADASNNLEIVKVTARAADTLTIVRGQEGTTARAYAIADKVEVRITAAGLANKLDKDTGGQINGGVGVSGAAGTPRIVQFLTAGLTRWVLTANGDAESAGNLGSNFTINRYNDAGVAISEALRIDRASGDTTLTGNLAITGSLTVGGGTIVTTTAAQTLTNKTLTAPIVASFLNGGNVQTMFTITDTVVGRATTDTLTNKTITGLAAASTILDSGGTPYRLGFKGLPQTAQNAGFTLALSHACKHVYSKNTGAQAITIPTNASVAYTVGEDFITIINNGTTALTIVPAGGVTLKQAGTLATGTRTLAVGGWATILLVEADLWFLNGVGVT